MNLFKFIRNPDGNEFTTFPKTFEKYRWYKPILICISAAILYMLFMVISIEVMAIIYPGFSLSAMSDTTYTIEGIFATFSLAFFIPAVYIPTRLLYKRPFISQISALGKWNWSLFIKTAIISAIVCGAFTIIPTLIDGTPIMNHFTIATFILCMLVTPFQCFAEEYLFRGFFMQTFGSWFRIPIVAIILQAIIFAFAHEYNPNGLIDVLIFGIVMGLITWYSKGLEISTAIHWINNTTAFLAIGLGIQNYTTQLSITDSMFGISITVITVLLILLIEKKYKWFGFKKNKTLIEC